MNKRLTTLFIACLSTVGSFGFALDTPTVTTPSIEMQRTDTPIHNETINHYKTMDRGMFEDQNFNKMEVRTNEVRTDVDDARIVKYRLAIQNEPTLVSFVDSVQFTQRGDTVVIFGTVDSEITKAKIESIVRDIPGVVNVENKLIVK